MAKYFKLYRSEDNVTSKLTNRSIRRAIKQLEKGKSTRTVAKDIGVTTRHVQRLWKEYKDKGVAHVQGRAGRPIKPMLPEEIKAVLDAHALNPGGVMQITRSLGNRTSHRRVYKIMKFNGLVGASRRKSKKRK